MLLVCITSRRGIINENPGRKEVTTGFGARRTSNPEILSALVAARTIGLQGGRLVRHTLMYISVSAELGTGLSRTS